jgi:hypothetical protein
VASLSGIQQLRPCSEQEAEQVLARLKADGGAGPAFAATLRQQGASLFAGLVVGTEAIGDLVTIWMDVAGVRARERHGRPCFLVREVLAALRDPARPRQQPPKDDLRIILAMMDSIEQGTFSPLVVFASMEVGLYIVDGNKSAVACYEDARQRRVRNGILPVIVPCLPPSTVGRR